MSSLRSSSSSFRSSLCTFVECLERSPRDRQCSESLSIVCQCISDRTRWYRSDPFHSERWVRWMADLRRNMAHSTSFWSCRSVTENPSIRQFHHLSRQDADQRREFVDLRHWSKNKTNTKIENEFLVGTRNSWIARDRILQQWNSYHCSLPSIHHWFSHCDDE